MYCLGAFGVSEVSLPKTFLFNATSDFERMSVVRTARNCISSAAPLVMLLRTFCFEVTNCLTLCIVQDLK